MSIQGFYFEFWIFTAFGKLVMSYKLSHLASCSYKLSHFMTRKKRPVKINHRTQHFPLVVRRISPIYGPIVLWNRSRGYLVHLFVGFSYLEYIHRFFFIRIRNFIWASGILPISIISASKYSKNILSGDQFPANILKET